MVARSRTFSKFTSNNGEGTQAPPPINGGTDPAPVGGLRHMGTVVLASQYSVQRNYLCEHQNNYFSDPELSLFISYLHKPFNLNHLSVVYATGLTMAVPI